MLANVHPSNLNLFFISERQGQMARHMGKTTLKKKVEYQILPKLDFQNQKKNVKKMPLFTVIFALWDFCLPCPPEKIATPPNYKNFSVRIHFWRNFKTLRGGVIFGCITGWGNQISSNESVCAIRPQFCQISPFAHINKKNAVDDLFALDESVQTYDQELSWSDDFCLVPLTQRLSAFPWKGGDCILRGGCTWNVSRTAAPVVFYWGRDVEGRCLFKPDDSSPVGNLYGRHTPLGPRGGWNGIGLEFRPASPRAPIFRILRKKTGPIPGQVRPSLGRVSGNFPAAGRKEPGESSKIGT